MGKLGVGLLAFAAGTAVGLLVARAYFQAHGLGLVLQGASDKVFGQGSTAGKLAAQLGDSLQGVS